MTAFFDLHVHAAPDVVARRADDLDTADAHTVDALAATGLDRAALVAAASETPARLVT